jgi:hypothetical protein
MAGASLDYRLALAAIHAVLIKEWDPIGVADEPMAQDEYDSYIPVVLRLLREGADDAEIAAHLAKIETQEMGLDPLADRNRRVAVMLREAING